jgi:predicted RNase H-like HicB family nuclease
LHRIAFGCEIPYDCGIKLTAIIYPDSETNWLVAKCPEIGTTSQGHTENEALANLREATDLYLESFPHAVKKAPVIHTFESVRGNRYFLRSFCPNQTEET